MTCIVITAIGGDVAQGVAQCIRDAYPDWKIIGTDMGLRHGGRLACDAFVQAPSARDAHYIDWLGELLDKTAADYCVPMSEAELARLMAEGHTDTLRTTKLITAGQKALTVGGDKLKTAQFLETLGLNPPWSVAEVSELPSEPFPCIYKPRSGAGSKAIFTCGSLEQAEFFSSNFPGGVFQELLLPHESEITCGVFRDRKGRVAVVQLLRTLVGGATGWASVVDHADVRALCASIADNLDLRGSINVQLRQTDDGPRVFEINARFSSTSFMRHRLGFQDVVWTLEDLEGQTPNFVSPQVGTELVKTHDVAIISDEFRLKE